MRTIPRDTSDFREIIRQGKVYVDKTAGLYELVRPGADQFYFLARPRHFGKTLMISTLAEIFSGNRELFEGLHIASTDYDWSVYPVIRLDMSSVTAKGGTIKLLNDRLCQSLEHIAETYHVPTHHDYAPEFLKSLIVDLAKFNDEGKVVILIDEYDAPVSELLDDLPLLRETRDFLNAFYAVIKASNGHLRFAMLTGVYKFTKIGLFASHNSPVDITMDPRFATIVGFTEAELRANFKDHIHALAETKNVDDEDIVSELKKWHGGYAFSDGQPEKVCNPYSIACGLTPQRIDNHWETSGVPILHERLRQLRIVPEDLNHAFALRSEFETCDAKNPTLSALLYQGGYLTLAGYSARTRSHKLRVPNEEMRMTLSHIITRV